MMRRVSWKETELLFAGAELRRSGKTLSVKLSYQAVYGMGEKYDGLNHKGKTVVNEVEEKFCFQGEKTYCPAPFFFTNSGFGLFADTFETTVFAFNENEILITLPEKADVVLFAGAPKQIIAEYMALGGEAKLPPAWAFGVWASANRWNKQSDVEELLSKMEEYDLPSSVIVVEAWSDEATFYIFNGARYEPVPGGKALQYQDFDFSASPWPDPKGLIEKIHRAGSHLVLWQIPVYKKQGKDEIPNLQNDLDRADAAQRGLCVKLPDGTPYTIPEGHWFGGSMVPDFTNPSTQTSWFDKRNYLLEIGVDGFKTDGGEFILRDDVCFADGTDGRQGKNRYALDYTRSYSGFIGGDRVLFSRAGFAPQHTVPIHWGGDQQSQNCELRSVLLAGLSASLSGMIFWGFDIAGYAGPLPSLDLYRRAMALGCFCPVMQWHSEPDGGQFRELMAGAEGNNERSPWNMAEAYNCPELIAEMQELYRIRSRLIPYLERTAKECAAHYMPMMRPLIYDWPGDSTAEQCDDEFMLGDALLVAPVLEENAVSRRVYLPEGEWIGYFSGRVVNGGQTIDDCQQPIPVFIRAEYKTQL
ncbi:MAG: glycosyl hydrolase [Oscillospiraceae bacterium]|nr:glycosyl hydrolase [Oscillospiraceae bacterium]